MNMTSFVDFVKEKEIFTNIVLGLIKYLFVSLLKSLNVYLFLLGLWLRKLFATK